MLALGLLFVYRESLEREPTSLSPFLREEQQLPAGSILQGSSGSQRDCSWHDAGRAPQAEIHLVPHAARHLLIWPMHVITAHHDDEAT